MVSFSSPTYSDPSLVASADWVRDLLTGSLGVTLAMLAIAWVGFGLLQGRIALRDGARIVLGCFILFGAPIIASAFVRFARADQTDRLATLVYVAPPAVSVPAHPPQFDPYAGASVPNH